MPGQPRIYIATTNPGKLREFREAALALKQDLSIEPLPGMAELEIPVEDGETFEANASTAEHTWPSTAVPASHNGHGSLAGNGAEEYATAERYLNSEPRDSAQAAKWLWKAMAKHNGPAALALADLYLKGEGVSKNCDQARVLLDSAARRDMAGAGERLRNLQAFGCQ